MRKLFYLLLVFVFVGTIQAQTMQPLPVDSLIRTGKLENGLTYYIRHNEYPPQRANFYIAQKVGSMQEEDNQAGLAHFLEHIAFNGTKNYPGKKTMLNYLESIGVKFGANVNAYTSFDETVYNINDVPVLRSATIDSCLLVLHDWSSFISLKDEQIDEERLVIKEEWRTRHDAQSRIWDKQLPIIYEGSKYANRMPIGSMDVIDHFPYQVLRDYYHKWYRPDLQGIVIVGDIHVDEVEAKIKEMFADIPKPVNPAERIYFPVADNPAPIVAVTTDPENTRTNVALYMKHEVMPAAVKNTEKGLYINLLKNMVSSMLSNRFTEIAQKPDAPFTYAYAYDGRFFVSKTKDAWTVGAGSKEGKIEETLASMARENERAKKFGFTESELERVKANMLSGYENAYNNRNKRQNGEYVNYCIRNFLDNNPITGMEFLYDYMKKQIPAVTLKEVNDFAKELVSGNNVVISVTGPEKEGLVYPSKEKLLSVFNNVIAENIELYKEKVITEPLIAQKPKAGKIVKTEKDRFDATVWTLSNGMKVVLKKTDFKDDEISMSSYSYGGTSTIATPDIYNGSIASAVPSIGGLGQFSALDLRKMLAGKNVSVRPAVYEWTQSFVGGSSKKDVETLFQLLYLNFTAPRKDEDVFKSTLASMKEQLKNKRANPSSYFGDSINYAMFGNDPRIKPMEAEDVDKLDYDRIITLYKQLFANPGSFTFTFIGTLDEALMKPLVETYLASLPAGNVEAKYNPANSVPVRKGKILNTFEQEMKTPKASVFNLYSGTLDYNMKNTLTMSVLKQVLDLVFSEAIRDKEGGSYGVGSSSFISRIPEGDSKIYIFFDSDPAKFRKLNDIAIAEFKKIAENGPRDKDMQKVKEYMNKKYLEDIKRNGYWLGIMDSYFFFKEDRDTDYVSTLNSITGDDVKTLLGKLLSQGNFIEVIMTAKN
ncbi:MAG: insulinase family protein [Dysgonamonadaceae bacterium]